MAALGYGIDPLHPTRAGYEHVTDPTLSHAFQPKSIPAIPRKDTRARVEALNIPWLPRYVCLHLNLF